MASSDSVAIYQRLRSRLLLCILLLFSPSSLAAEKALPFYIPVAGEQSETVLGAVEQALQALKLGERQIRPSSRWHDYQQGIRAGRRGIYLAPPHFAAWAIHKHGFRPLLRLPGSLTYVVAAARNDASIFEMNDLSNQLVCSKQPLNLDYLLINRAFDNPLLSADIMIVSSVIGEMLRASSRCRGFSLTNREFESVETRFPDRYIRLQQSIKYKNLALIVDPVTATQDEESVAAIETFLNSSAAREALEPWLGSWSSQLSWVNAVPEDYPRNHMQVLESFWR